MRHISDRHIVPDTVLPMLEAPRMPLGKHPLVYDPYKMILVPGKQKKRKPRKKLLLNPEENASPDYDWLKSLGKGALNLLPYAFAAGVIALSAQDSFAADDSAHICPTTDFHPSSMGLEGIVGDSFSFNAEKGVVERVKDGRLQKRKAKFVNGKPVEFRESRWKSDAATKPETLESCTKGPPGELRAETLDRYAQDGEILVMEREQFDSIPDYLSRYLPEHYVEEHYDELEYILAISSGAGMYEVREGYPRRGGFGADFDSLMDDLLEDFPAFLLDRDPELARVLSRDGPMSVEAFGVISELFDKYSESEYDELMDILQACEDWSFPSHHVAEVGRALCDNVDKREYLRFMPRVIESGFEPRNTIVFYFHLAEYDLLPFSAGELADIASSQGYNALIQLYILNENHSEFVSAHKDDILRLSQTAGNLTSVSFRELGELFVTSPGLMEDHCDKVLPLAIDSTYPQFTLQSIRNLTRHRERRFLDNYDLISRAAIEPEFPAYHLINLLQRIDGSRIEESYDDVVAVLRHVNLANFSLPLESSFERLLELGMMNENEMIIVYNWLSGRVPPSEKESFLGSDCPEFEELVKNNADALVWLDYSEFQDLKVELAELSRSMYGTLVAVTRAFPREIFEDHYDALSQLADEFILASVADLYQNYPDRIAYFESTWENWLELSSDRSGVATIIDHMEINSYNASDRETNQRNFSEHFNYIMDIARITEDKAQRSVAVTELLNFEDLQDYKDRISALAHLFGSRTGSCLACLSTDLLDDDYDLCLGIASKCGEFSDAAFASLRSSTHLADHYREILDSYEIVPGSFLIDSHLNESDRIANLDRIKDNPHLGEICDVCNISQLHRYSDHVLEESYTNMTGGYDPDKPNAVFIADTADHNDMFELFRVWNMEIQKFIEGYNIHLIESSSSQQAFHSMDRIAELFCSEGRKIDVLALGGHGTAISVGDFSAYDISREFPKYAHVFSETPEFITYGCQNGRESVYGKNVLEAILHAVQRGRAHGQCGVGGLVTMLPHGRFNGRVRGAFHEDGASSLRYEDGKLVEDSPPNNAFSVSHSSDATSACFSQGVGNLSNLRFRLDMDDYDFESAGLDFGVNKYGMVYLHSGLDFGKDSVDAEVGLALLARPEYLFRNYDYSLTPYFRLGASLQDGEFRGPSLVNIGLHGSLNNVFNSPFSIEGRYDYMDEDGIVRNLLEGSLSFDLSRHLSLHFGYSMQDFEQGALRWDEDHIRAGLELNLGPQFLLFVDYARKEDEYGVYFAVNNGNIGALLDKLFR